MITIYRLTGKHRSVTPLQSILCIGELGITTDSLARSAIKFGSDNHVYIDKNRCSKCYLCKLKSRYIHLNAEHYPFVSEEEDSKCYDITPKDQIHFESNLSLYAEEAGISKWIYCLFKIYGLENTYTECAISKEYVPVSILKKVGKYRADGVYGKSVIVDVESTVQKFVFVFENKKSDIQTDDWITEAFKQIIAYASSSIYRNSKNEIYFVFCYNGSYDIRDRALIVIRQSGLLRLLREVFGDKDNYHLVILSSAKIFGVIKRSLKTNKKDEEDLIDLILRNEVVLPSK